jgi:hypothetical protein
MKRDFIKAVSGEDNLKVISVAVKLPSGAVEVITNHEDLLNKARYYVDNYDDNFCLKHNKDIQIVGFMVV